MRKCGLGTVYSIHRTLEITVWSRLSLEFALFRLCEDGYLYKIEVPVDEPPIADSPS